MPVTPVAIMAHKNGLARINVPVLIIWDDRGRDVPLGHTDLLGKRIAGASNLILEGARHPCYLDAPEVFNRALVDFVGGLDAERPGLSPGARKSGGQEVGRLGCADSERGQGASRPGFVQSRVHLAWEPRYDSVREGSRRNRRVERSTFTCLR